MEETPITPTELARELGHTDRGRRIREWARETYPEHPRYARWEFTGAQADAARAALH